MQLAFAAVGSMIGGQMLGTGIVALGMNGAMLGWTAGSLIGSFFGPKQRSYGPRLTDKRVQGSSYGSCIPWVAGAPRLAGEVIWASDIRELAHTEEQGKGGGGASYTSYTYEVDLLVRLTENVVPGMDKVWKYGDLVYNVSAEADPATVTASENTDKWSRITYYSGAADQMPDPDYEAAVGAGNAPATRGGASVFIKDLQLGQTNAVPSLTFRLVETVPGVDVGGEVMLGAGTTPQVVALDDTYAIEVHSNGGSGGYMNLLNISGADPSIIHSVNFLPANTTVGPLTRIDDSHALLMIQLPADPRVSMIVVGRSGSTATYGSRVVVPAGISITPAGDQYCDTSQLDAARYLTTYQDGSLLSSFVTNVSGYTVTSIGAKYSSSALTPYFVNVRGIATGASTGVAIVTKQPFDNEILAAPMTISGDVVSVGALSTAIDTMATMVLLAQLPGANAFCGYSLFTGSPSISHINGALASGTGGTVARVADHPNTWQAVAFAATSGFAFMLDSVTLELFVMRISPSGQPSGAAVLVSSSGGLQTDAHCTPDGDAVAVYRRGGVVYARNVIRT